MDLSNEKAVGALSKHRASPNSESGTVSSSPDLLSSLQDVNIHTKAHVLDAEEVVRQLKADAKRGLSEADACERLELFGKNELEQEPGKSLLQLILEQFQDLLVRILLSAAVVSFILALFEGGAEEGVTAFIEPLVILIILILNAAVGVWQESNAEKALEALKELQPAQGRVLRGGVWRLLPSANLVPGDIIDVRCGDKVPADCRVLALKSTTLRVEQSQLTGESVTVNKDAEVLAASYEDCEVQSKSNLLFSSTTVASGHAVAVVVATGMRTEIGKIQSAVQEAGADDEDQTPLQQKLDEFGEILSKVIFVICIVVWVINIKHFSDPVHGGFLRGCIYYFKIAVALAVAAIPEGLPAVITTCLALGTRKMAKKNAIVRKLASVETLGCTTVICSDKTGTLTTNEMTCVRFCVPNMRHGTDEYTCEGSCYSPIGAVNYAGSSHSQRRKFHHIEETDQNLQWLARCATLCNEARLEIAPGSQGMKFTRLGEPTEAALLVLVEKLGCTDSTLNARFLQCEGRKEQAPMPFCDYWASSWNSLATLEFTRERKSMSVLCRERNSSQNTLFVKGAPESVLERCTSVLLPNGTVTALTEGIRKKIQNDVDTMAADALRTLALAMKRDCGELADYDSASPSESRHPARKLLEDAANFAKIESDLIFLGLVGLMDPPRPEVSAAIDACRGAGIKVVMITGDNKLTAEAVASMIHIVDDGCVGNCSFTGKEFEGLSLEEKKEVLSQDGVVFSRTEPKHKQMIIRLLRELGETTAMTGDGVNDAPALKQADIGVAMGIAGTEVAKEAADMVLADDNFSTIVAAVEEGRSIYNNMKAFIRYLISSNIGEVASIFFTAALGVPEGLSPVQLLWVNLVTDGPPATALGFNPPDLDVMKREPRHREDKLISNWIFLRYLLIGIYVGFSTVGIFVSWFVTGLDNGADPHTLVSLKQLMHWNECPSWEDFQVAPVYGMKADDPCSFFTVGKVKASSLSLTVLVVIEMFNAFNALSEDASLLQLPPWTNPYLVVATVLSIAVHCCILYIPFLSRVFGVVPLTAVDWVYVVVWSLPVIFIDEGLKAIGRMKEAARRRQLSLSRSQSQLRKLQ
ncbi:sarco/endoplasmic reticulum Ca2+-ATPase [Toxoplasma gondii GAB2-2007-GAL-DOM2]|uniref:P-type Ca(2+) transporter n=5 Tax=Toxoplasma gondii TaxID=5811 RepID=A0A125YSA2_TOXGG|nr:calcium ATPase SERCA-like [Toxoplasma gondii]EPR64156.1 sarco/endoplasmic reticulum Ca2+-ATPase [Toxoplasma gondii GT1]KFG48249.1 sarco/endoplasmic reticulum Ca2+-ATPase [Toxoplasma gondii GAB2-2007-GAL-DOM2]